MKINMKELKLEMMAGAGVGIMVTAVIGYINNSYVKSVKDNNRKLIDSEKEELELLEKEITYLKEVKLIEE